MSQVRELLQMLRYDEDHFVESYSFLNGRTENRVDFAAFARQPLDMSNAVLVGQAASRDRPALEVAFDAADALACPAVVVAGLNDMQIFASKDRAFIDAYAYGERPSDRILDSLRQDALLKSKLRHPEPSLFQIDVDLLTNARRKATSALRDRVVDARDALREAAHVKNYRLDATETATLIVDALTCLFAEDKFQVPYESPQWEQEVQTRFEHLRLSLDAYSPMQRALFDFAREFLREGVNYRSMDSVVIADLYEPRLVDADPDGGSGIIYTPFELASRIMDRVPVETISPDQRTVLDFACGSGTLLLAAHERLTQAHPQETSVGRMHDYLIQKLEGWDRDPFAVQLTHLSLTLRAHPLGNGWRVEQRDTLTADPPQRAIVVANPPWGARRTGRGGRGVARTREDAVTPFLDWGMRATAPGGLLTMFVPASWLSAAHGSPTRRRLASGFDLLDVWRLPEETFRGADVKGAVFIARRRKPGQARATHYLTHRIHDMNTLARFAGSGSGPQPVVSRRPVGGEAIGTGSPLNMFVEARADQSVDQVFNIRTGPPRGRGEGGGVLYRWLGDVRQMSHFGLVAAANTQPAMYPRDFDRKASWSPDRHYDAKKLLITRVRRSGNPWKIKVGLSFEPVIPSNNQYALSVKESDRWESDESALYAAAAIFGSAPINAWLDDTVATGNIPRGRVSSIRLPEGWSDLATAGLNLCTLSEAGNVKEFSRAARDVDQLVFDLYEIPDSLRTDTLRRFEQVAAPEGGTRYLSVDEVGQRNDPNRGLQTRTVDGVVLGVEGELIRVWVDEVTPRGGTLMRVPVRLPGATLLEEITFTATVPPGGLISDGHFALHKSSFEDLDLTLVDTWPDSPMDLL